MSLFDLSVLSVAEVVGDFGFKSYARTGSTNGFIQGVIGYVGVIYYLIRCLREGNVMYVNGMWDGVSAVFESIAAYFFLGERLNRPIEYAGLVFVIAGLFMLHAPDGKIPYY